MQDIESDFWKEIFRHLQHRNLSRIDAKRLSLSDAPSEIDAFVKAHTDENFAVENCGSYITFEAPVTETIKVRLFIQNQIKASLMQKNGADWVKIADAKFFNNPFSEIQLLLENREKYKKDLASQKITTVKENMKTRITVELMKALLMKKFGKDAVFEVVVTEESFNFKISKGTEKREVMLSLENFTEEIKGI